MARMFGTDGVRGVVNKDLTPELALKLGRAAAYVLTEQTNKKARIAIGMDTRGSGDMLQSALVAGICSAGADALVLGVVPTPAVSKLVVDYGADAGAVISASHNPVEFNGIKFFNSEGFKLADDIEDEIEAIVKDEALVRLAAPDAVGAVHICEGAEQDYARHILACADGALSKLRVGIDCANGAAAATAGLIFPALGAECIFIGDKPDGTNINRGVGSTHLENVAALVREHSLDMGIAFDGDADRCLAVDEHGEEIDGDKIIAILAQDMKRRGTLKNDTAVVTVMSNLGFMEFAENNGISAVCTAVGDRYVLEEMRRGGHNIGGEQSGHVILLDDMTTGDGQLTAVKLLCILARSGKKASELAAVMTKYPQTLVNIPATQAQKAFYRDDEVSQGFVEYKQQQLMGMGRVLVRVSGTEPLIRVMVEGKDEVLIKKAAEELAYEIKERLLKA